MLLLQKVKRRLPIHLHVLLGRCRNFLLTKSRDVLVPNSLYANLSEFTSRDNCRRFFVFTLGRSGSNFLAKLLNAHAEVLCFHEGVRIQSYPVYPISERDRNRYAAYLLRDRFHDSYHTVGDVGSLAMDSILRIPQGLAHRSILFRHPVRMLRTKMEMLREEPREIDSVDQIALRTQLEAAGLHALTTGSSMSAEDIYFLWTAVNWRSMGAAAFRFDSVIRLEDLSDELYASRVLGAITGVEYASALIAQLLRRRVNTRTNQAELSEVEVLEQLGTKYREWYLQIVEPVASKMGYGLYERKA